MQATAESLLYPNLFARLDVGIPQVPEVDERREQHDREIDRHRRHVARKERTRC